MMQNQITVKRSWTATITMPPSLNTMYINVPGKGRVKNGKYQLWENSVVPYLALALHRASGAVHIHYQFHLGTAFRGDVSNRIKPAEDALKKAGAIVDDNHRYVRGFSVGVDYDQDQGSAVTITITPAESFDAGAVVDRFTKSLAIFMPDK
jgi:hypothetical protein